MSRDLLEDDDRALEQWADESAALSRGVLDAAVCAKVPIAVARRLLRRWLVRCGVKTDLSRQGFEVLLAALRAGRATRFSLGTGYACLRRGELRFKRR